METEANYFTALAAVDCSKHIEHKGDLSYLSWPFAVQELCRRHPDATWDVIETPEGLPYWATPLGYFVKVRVTVGGVSRMQTHPVLDSRNKTIQAPTAFDINTSIMRCLVKAIALHGLGLYIYAGEDLPVVGGKDSEPTEEDAKREAAIREWVNTIQVADTLETLAGYRKELEKQYGTGNVPPAITAEYNTRRKELADKAKGKE